MSYLQIETYNITPFGSVLDLVERFLILLPDFVVVDTVKSATGAPFCLGRYVTGYPFWWYISTMHGF
jgi:hypothetical protein